MMIELHYQTRYRWMATCRWFGETLPRRVAMGLPRRIAFWAFIRVCAVCAGDRVGDDFSGLMSESDWQNFKRYILHQPKP